MSALHSDLGMVVDVGSDCLNKVRATSVIDVIGQGFSDDFHIIMQVTIINLS
jgi:hypothetical protein